MQQTEAPLAERVAPLVGALPPAPPSSIAVIESIATGAPARVVDQNDAAVRTAALFADPAQRERVTRIHRNTMVNTRHLAVDPIDDEFTGVRTTPANIRERMNLFYTHAAPLAVDVARRAHDRLPGGGARLRAGWGDRRAAACDARWLFPVGVRPIVEPGRAFARLRHLGRHGARARVDRGCRRRCPATPHARTGRLHRAGVERRRAPRDRRPWRRGHRARAHDDA